MIRSLVMRHHPDALLQAVDVGDIGTVSTMLGHLQPLPNVCHVHSFCLILLMCSEIQQPV